MNTEDGTISMDLELAHKPEKVWRALTNAELLSQWLLPAFGFDAAVGTSFTFKTQPAGGFDGTVACKVLEAEAPKKLVLSWVVGVMEIDTVVTFTLTPTGTGTRLSLVHRGFKLPAQKGAMGGQRYGWNMMTARLPDVLARIDGGVR